MSQLENVKAGDTVYEIVMTTYGGSVKAYKVERVTKQYIITKFSKFRKSDGCESGMPRDHYRGISAENKRTDLKLIKYF